ncbi:MAG: Hsp20/alpha crystallin family protein [Acidobacteriia bacterium]|nr:Hsp20/alpha crystallin family protein [Methyloceanibacter sp.]MBX5472840.1 Hsp20/alpha crystallin family protein [Acetobacteraceae bacterium]MCL6490756.1 Hsp20/alpha crystallin family protein [Terriglobia bacterium]
MPNTSIPITHPVPAEVPPAHAPGIWYAFRAEMDRLFDRLASFLGWAPVSRAHFESTFDIAAPVVDITEDDSAFKLTAEFPGMTEKDIEVLLSGDTLTIRGEKREEREEKQKNYHLSERVYGEFRRSFFLPEGVEREKIVAEFANGVLTVTLPKSAQAKPKQIEVKPTSQTS